MAKEKRFFKRFTALVLAMCCIFTMFPSAAAGEADNASTTDKQFRYIWLISQPGIAVRIEAPSAGNTGVYFKNMNEKKEPPEWLPTKLYTDPTDGEQYYVLIPDESTAGVDPNYDGNYNGTTSLCTAADNSSITTGEVFGDPQPGVGYLRLYCTFRKKMLPNTSVPAWKGSTFQFVPKKTSPLKTNQVNETNQDTEYWAGNASGGQQFYIGFGSDTWQHFVKTAKYQHQDDKSQTTELGGYAPAPYAVRFVKDFHEQESTYYYAQVRIPKRWVDAYVADPVHGGYMTDASRTLRQNWSNNTMFQFVSDKELPLPSSQSTVIFDWNLPGETANVQYLVGAGSEVNVPTGVTSKKTLGVTFKFKGWYDQPTGGNKIAGTTVTAPDTSYQVYYAQWEIESVDIPVDPPEMGDGDMYVGYFDYNLPGTGVTSAYSAAGKFEWTAKVDGKTKTYTVQLHFQFPNDPYREGYKFKLGHDT
ncbi:hypothetical protein DXA92_12940 [Agathobaculum butyriciproducens]|nr:hypothetical protein DXA94_03760 [Agathobaculum butyriciproducens]RGC58867.1 hypothetical protein DXA92_12940 [Agathobaculum butyriciproducens]